jgi:lipid-A-disaccharide synthase
VFGANVVPEFLQGDCTASALAEALIPLLADTAERRRQVEAFARLDEVMGPAAAPSAKAADTVLAVIRQARAARLPDPGNVLSTAQGGAGA